MPPSAKTSLSTPRYYEIIVVAIATLVLCVYIFGLQAINPLETTWMLDKDPGQHYLGWKFFRNEPWRWPPGRIADFGIPEGSSIVFTDSIPLLALPLKVVSAWLPRDFQYFGLWMTACFFLNGYFGLRIMSRLTTSAFIRVLCALFFVVSPPLLLRATGHESLMAQWLILAAIEAHMLGWRGLRWLAIAAAASLCHAYLLMMVLGQMAATMISAWLIDKNQRFLILARDGAAIFAVIVLLMWTAGYFVRSNGILGAGGYGLYSMNILSFVDPLRNWSRFIKQHPIHPDFAILGEHYGQHEGFLYLGAGMLFLAAMALALILTHEKKLVGPKGLIPPRWIPLVAVAVVFWCLALSNKVMFSDVHLFTVPLPDWMYQYVSVFRASGRFGWVAFYVLTLGVLAVVVRRLSSRAAGAVLLAMLALQIGDQSGKYHDIRHFISERFAWSDPLASPFWNAMATNAERIVVLPPHPPMVLIYLPFAKLAASFRLQTNAAYIARNDDAAITSYGNRKKNALSEGHYENNTIYVFCQKNAFDCLPEHLKKYIIPLDGYFVLPPGLEALANPSP